MLRLSAMQRAELFESHLFISEREVARYYTAASFRSLAGGTPGSGKAALPVAVADNSHCAAAQLGIVGRGEQAAQDRPGFKNLKVVAGNKLP